MKVFQKIMGAIIFIFLVGTIILNLLGYQHYAVKSDSMQPSVKRYALVYVKTYNEVNENMVKEEDVVALHKGGVNVLHRITEVHEAYIVTKGDQNNHDDGKTPYTEVIGIMAFQIPLVGIFFLHYWTLVILGLVIMIPSIYELYKKRSRFNEKS